MPARTRITAEPERLADGAQSIVPPWRGWGCHVAEHTQTGWTGLVANLIDEWRR